MPFASGDLTAKVNALFQSRELQDTVSNPFIVGAIYTIIIMAVIITISRSVDTRDFVMTGVVIFIASILITTVVSRGLMARYDTKFSFGEGIVPFMVGNGEDVAGELVDDWPADEPSTTADEYPLFPTDFLDSK